MMRMFGRVAAEAGSQRRAMGLFDAARPCGACLADRRAPGHCGGRAGNLDSVANLPSAGIAIRLGQKRCARQSVARHALDWFRGQAPQL